MSEQTKQQEVQFDWKSLLQIVKADKKDGSGMTRFLVVDRQQMFNKLLIRKAYDAGVPVIDRTGSGDDLDDIN